MQTDADMGNTLGIHHSRTQPQLCDREMARIGRQAINYTLTWRRNTLGISCNNSCVMLTMCVGFDCHGVAGPYVMVHFTNRLLWERKDIALQSATAILRSASLTCYLSAGSETRMIRHVAGVWHALPKQTCIGWARCACSCNSLVYNASKKWYICILS